MFLIRLILGQWLGVKKRTLRIGVGLVQSVKGGPEKNGWGLGGGSSADAGLLIPIDVLSPLSAC